MELKQVRHFLSVAETLNFTQASEQNEISQPALTKSIQNLEEEFGGLLIIRDGKNTRLTELEQKLRSEFSEIVKREECAKLLARDHLEAGHRMLNIGIASSLGPAKFAEFFSEYLSQNPNTRVVLHQIDQAASQQAILSGFLDACICTRRSTDNHKITTTPLFDERLMLAFGQNERLAGKSEISLSEFAEQCYFDRLKCEFRSQFLAMLDDKGMRVRPLVQSDREDWIQQFVAAGNGVCMLGEYSVIIPTIKLLPITGIDMKRTVAISFVSGSAASSSITQLEKLARIYDWGC